jgi:hypothetical protein
MSCWVPFCAYLFFCSSPPRLPGGLFLRRRETDCAGCATATHPEDLARRKSAARRALAGIPGSATRPQEYIRLSRNERPELLRRDGLNQNAPNQQKTKNGNDARCPEKFSRQRICLVHDQMTGGVPSFRCSASARLHTCWRRSPRTRRQAPHFNSSRKPQRVRSFKIWKPASFICSNLPKLRRLFRAAKNTGGLTGAGKGLPPSPRNGFLFSKFTRPAAIA